MEPLKCHMSKSGLATAIKTIIYGEASDNSMYVKFLFHCFMVSKKKVLKKITPYVAIPMSHGIIRHVLMDTKSMYRSILTSDGSKIGRFHFEARGRGNR